MKHYCNPMNLEYRYQFYRKIDPNENSVPFKVYREAADPSLILFKGTYFLFPSMTAGFFTSDDLHDWKLYEFKGNIPIYDYAPDVRVFGDYLYFSASGMADKNCSFFRTKDPRTEAFEEISGTFSFWDPNLFIDDDGRMYLYWGCSNMEPIYGVELNPETMELLTEKQALIDSHADVRGYERYGEEHVEPKSKEQINDEVEMMLANIKKQANDMHQDMGMSEETMKEILRGHLGNKTYMEGPWMTKHEGRYYLQYAVTATPYNVYGDGVYVSDYPLGPFYPANNNPYSYNPGGFITGAGHGSTLEDKDGNFWHVSSMRISHNEDFERRLGIWKAGFDVDGELYCDQRYASWPVAMGAKAFDQPDWMLLSYKKPVQVSSGEGAENITDEDIRTFWKAGSSKAGEYAVVDLEKAYRVSAVQINFVDDGMTRELPEDLIMHRSFYEERWIDQKKQSTNWLLEGSTDGENYFTIMDKRKTDTDYSHDFIELDESREIRYLKLTIEKLPYEQVATVAGIRVFGKGDGEAPGQASEVIVDYDGAMDMDVSWQTDGAVGANILWGYTPEKLYHNRMVYGDTKGHIGALVTGQPIYVRIDTFNENGITEGNVIPVKE